jgi:hypothetical protein
MNLCAVVSDQQTQLQRRQVFFSRPAVLKAVTYFLREETLPAQKISSAVVPLMKVGHMLLPKPNISFSSPSINSLMAHRIDDTIY